MPLIAGSKLAAFCSKCKGDREHTVIEVTNRGRSLSKVRCDACRDVHAFRRPKAPQRPTRARKPKPDRAPARSRKAKSAEAVIAEEWAQVESVVAAAQKIPYVLSGAYDKGQVVEHAVFGPGIVLALLGPNKMEVLFRTGRRKLVCGRA